MAQVLLSFASVEILAFMVPISWNMPVSVWILPVGPPVREVRGLGISTSTGVTFNLFPQGMLVDSVS